MDELLKLVTAENLLGAIAILQLIDVRRQLRKGNARMTRSERRIDALEDPQPKGMKREQLPHPAH